MNHCPFLCLTILLSLAWSSSSDSRLLGGLEAIKYKDLNNDPLIKKVASFAVDTLNKADRGSNLVLLKVVKGTSQVVAGERYRLVLEVGVCTKPAYVYLRASSLHDCPVDKDSVTQWYADVWVKPTRPPQYVLNELHLYNEG